MQELSKNFTVQEFINSETANARGIDNSFKNQTHVENAIWLCKDYLEVIRAEARLIKPDATVSLSNGYRVPELNRLVGGSSTSDHMLGLAADISRIKGFTIYEAYTLILKALKKHNLKWKQLIFEEALDRNKRIYRWIHLGISRSNQRCELLYRKTNGQYLHIKNSELKHLVEGIA